MGQQEAQKHHFVPQFLLRPWLVEESTGQRTLRGYYWNPVSRALKCKLGGPKGFCFQRGLLALSAHDLGRDAIERHFFGAIDSRGAVAREALIEWGPNKLSRDQRFDFARLLLSLEARRRHVVDKLRTNGKAYLANELDADPEIRAAIVDLGISDSPSSYISNQFNYSLEDRALTNIQRLVDSPAVLERLMNARWDVRKVTDSDGSLVFSDRPLIRIHAYNHPNAVWALPLSPHAAFLACNSIVNRDELMRCSGRRFVEAMNVSSAAQTETYVFCIDDSHEHWLKEHLGRKA